MANIYRILNNFFRNFICILFIFGCIGVIWILTSHNPQFISTLSKNMSNLNPETSPSKELDKTESIENIRNKPNSSIKILCLINTSKKQLKNRAIHVNATWAKRCDKYLFLSYDPNISLPFLDLKVRESRMTLWEKIRKLFRWVYQNELENFDFFLRADDDSYFIIENLRHMLSKYNPNEALYFGCRFKPFSKSGYMSGGAGYILSREAVRQIVPAFNDPKICPQKIENLEDVKIGHCAGNLNFTFVDTRDENGRHRMLPFDPAVHFVTEFEDIHYQYMYYPYNVTEFECCANYMISFHYIDKNLMHFFEFLIYHTKVHGKIYDENDESSSVIKHIKFNK